VKANIEMCNGF